MRLSRASLLTAMIVLAPLPALAEVIECAPYEFAWWTSNEFGSTYISDATAHAFTIDLATGAYHHDATTERAAADLSFEVIQTGEYGTPESIDFIAFDRASAALIRVRLANAELRFLHDYAAPSKPVRAASSRRPKWALSHDHRRGLAGGDDRSQQRYLGIGIWDGYAMSRHAAAFAILAFMVPSAGFAEEVVVCTPEFYFNWREPSAIIIEIDEARAQGSDVIHIDLETGTFRALRGGDEAQVVGSGAMTIVNVGSLRENFDFVATEPDTGALLRIELRDESLPYIHVDYEGSTAAGHCVYE